MFNKLKQFKNLKSKANQIQSALGELRSTGSSGFGKVSVIMNGNFEIMNVTISPDLLQTSEQQKLQDLVRDAVNDASKKNQRAMAEKMRSMGGLDNFMK